MHTTCWVGVDAAASLSSVILSPIQQTFSPNTTPLLNMIWHPLAALRGGDGVHGPPASSSPTVVGAARTVLREGARDAAGDLAQLRKTVETIGRESLKQEMFHLARKTDRAAAASSLLSSRIKSVASTAVKELEAASNLVETRVQDAAIEAITKFKSEAANLLAAGEAVLGLDNSIMSQNVPPAPRAGEPRMLRDANSQRPSKRSVRRAQKKAASRQEHAQIDGSDPRSLQTSKRGGGPKRHDTKQ